MTTGRDQERSTARTLRFTFAFIMVLVCGAPAVAAQATAAIASAHPLATRAGQKALDAGGNAFDAAVAVAAALGVVEPFSSGLGGGGFFLLHRASDGHAVVIDARETAPGGIRLRHFLDEEGRPIPGATLRGGTAAAIPGTPAALIHIAERYGKLPLHVTLKPAYRLARDGFPADVRYTRIVALREAVLRGKPAGDVFLDRGSTPQVGYVVRQPALAGTLERLARSGAAGFYEGPVAHALIEAVNSEGGVWSANDLRAYRVIERAPVRFRYRGAVITSAGPPSAGGVALAQALGMLERYDIGALGSPETDHLVVETLRRAFRERAQYLGDPDFVRIPVAKLMSPEHAQRLGETIDSGKATPSNALTDAVGASGSHNTTHFSIVDAQGNRVAATLTINSFFGSGIMARATGVVLNNEMDDFTVRADVENLFGLRSGAPNLIVPGKRPLSAMTPTFVEDDKGVLVLGSAGGSRIVSQVLLAVLEYVRSPDVDLARILAMPRYHHQYLPDRIEVEPRGFPGEWRDAMEAKGHKLETIGRLWGNMQMVFKAKSGGAAQAANDPRGAGVAWY